MSFRKINDMASLEMFVFLENCFLYVSNASILFDTQEDFPEEVPVFLKNPPRILNPKVKILIPSVL